MNARIAYTKPKVVDYGSLVELTADVEHLNISAGLLRAVVGAAVISQPLVPGTDTGGVLPSSDAGGNTPGVSLPGDGGGNLPTDTTGTLGDPAGGTLGNSGVPGGGGGGGGAAGGGGSVVSSRLPFTGFSVFMVAFVGAGMAAAGASLRARLSRAR